MKARRITRMKVRQRLPSRCKILLSMCCTLVLFTFIVSFQMTNLTAFLDTSLQAEWISTTPTNQSNRLAASLSSTAQAPLQSNRAPPDSKLSTSTPPRLEFVHIPKTGGLAVELEAARHGVKWGMCHFVEPKKLVGGCNMPSQKAPLGRNAGNVAHDNNRLWASREMEYCPWWHLPPAYFLYRYAHDPTNPYHNASLFTIIRDPYARVMSEYYYESIIHQASPSQRNNPVVLNNFIARLLSPARYPVERPDYRLNHSGNTVYYARECHLIPQYHYVSHEETRVIPILLRFETLKEDFEQLMREYDMPFFHLPKEDVRDVVNRTLKLSDITPNNLRLIENVYEEDFREFGYTIQSNIIYPRPKPALSARHHNPAT